MPNNPEQLSLLDMDDDAPSSGLSIIASRPVVDLRNSQVMAFEYVACDHYSFLPSQNILSVMDLQSILETSKLLSLPEILLSVPADIFVEIDLSNKMAWALRSLLSQGTHITVLLAAAGGDAANNAIGSAMQNWRRVGCSVGIDGFGYAAVPALWPLVHHVDAVRFDQRSWACYAPMSFLRCLRRNWSIWLRLWILHASLSTGAFPPMMRFCFKRLARPMDKDQRSANSA